MNTALCVCVDHVFVWERLLVCVFMCFRRGHVSVESVRAMFVREYMVHISICVSTVVVFAGCIHEIV